MRFVKVGTARREIGKTFVKQEGGLQEVKSTLTKVAGVIRRIENVRCNWSYPLDGVDDYFIITEPIGLLSGDYIEVKFILRSLSREQRIWGPDPTEAIWHSLFRISTDGSAIIRPTSSASSTLDINIPAGTFVVNSWYTVHLKREGNVYTVLVNGQIIGTSTTTQTPSTIKSFGVYAGSAYMQGTFGYIEYNGTKWKLNELNTQVHYPDNITFGTELIGPSVLSNPSEVDSAVWTYSTVDKTWSLDTDGAVVGNLRFIPAVNMPLAYITEFDVVAIDGRLTCTNGIVNDPITSIVTTPERKRYYYIGTNDYVYANVFKRAGNNQVAKCTIKNISLRALNDTRLVILYNGNRDRWQLTPITRRAAYLFDGVDDYFQFQTPLSIDDLKELKIEFTLSQIGIVNRLFGNTTNYFSRMYVENTTNHLVFQPGNSHNIIVSSPLKVGKRYVAIVSKIGDVFQVSIEGLGQSARVTDSSPRTPISILGWNLAGGNRFNGMIHRIEYNGTVWTMNYPGTATQPSLPAGNNLTLVNGNAERWLSAPSQLRNIYSMDGVDDQWQFQVPLSMSSTGTRISFKFRINGDLSVRTYALMGRLSGFNSLINTTLTGGLRLRLTGSSDPAAQILTDDNLIVRGKVYELTVTRIDNLYQVFLDNRLVGEITTAQPVASFEYMGSMNAGSFALADIWDVIHNSVRWPLNNKYQSIQLPVTPNLGPELITPTVLATPNSVSSGWTYSETDKTWTLNGDGTNQSLNFLVAADLPPAYIAQFDIVQIAGVLTCTVGTFLANAVASNPVTSRFSDVGRCIYYRTSNENTNTVLSFKRALVDAVVTCVIKNISVRALNDTNPMVLRNGTNERWIEEIDQ